MIIHKKEPMTLGLMANMDKYLSPKQVSERFNLSISFLSKLRNKNRDEGAFLPYFKSGKKVLYRLSDLNAWIEQNIIYGEKNEHSN